MATRDVGVDLRARVAMQKRAKRPLVRLRCKFCRELTHMKVKKSAVRASSATCSKCFEPGNPHVVNKMEYAAIGVMGHLMRGRQVKAGN